MKFEINALTLKKGLEDIQVKGKHLTSKGFSNSNFGSNVFAQCTGNELRLYNGDTIFLASLGVTVTNELTTSSEVSFDSSSLIPYLKSFGNQTITFEAGDYITIIAGAKKASVPKLVNHPNIEAVQRLKNMVAHIRYEPQPQTLWKFGNFNFEGAFSITNNYFIDCIKNCELVKSGIYKLDFNQNVTISTTETVTNSYTETINPVFRLGEPATLQFSGALHSFFEKEQLLNFYVRDESPILIVANDRMLMKAPHVGGN